MVVAAGAQALLARVGALDYLARRLRTQAPEALLRDAEFTALLAKRAAQVTSMEYHDELSRTAAARLQAAGVRNVLLKVGDAAHSPAPFIGDQKFDAIVLTGSTPVLPPAYLDALKPTGRLLAIVGDAPAMTATLYRRGADGAFAATDLFETVVSPLIHAEQPSRFEF
jgi:protein-L-isoaspartate(D-aspartate) O-methyltransferase